MKDYQNIIDKYELYLDGELDENDRNEMENAIANDKELAELLEGHKLMIDGIRFSARKDLKGKLLEWDSAMSGVNDDQGGHKAVVRKLSWYYAAASVVLIALSVTFVYRYNANTYQRIAANHYEQYVGHSSLTRSGDAKRSPDDEIAAQYELGNYDAVIEKFAEFDRDRMSESSEFNLASAYMAKKRYDDAIPIFEDLAETSDIHGSRSKLYLALAYLYKDDPARALPLLNELTQDKSSAYYTKAAKILEDLN